MHQGGIPLKGNALTITTNAQEKARYSPRPCVREGHSLSRGCRDRRLALANLVQESLRINDRLVDLNDGLKLVQTLLKRRSLHVEEDARRINQRRQFFRRHGQHI